MQLSRLVDEPGLRLAGPSQCLFGKGYLLVSYFHCSVAQFTKLYNLLAVWYQYA